ncbi:Clp protease N-terminal domain-containing protein [Kitasatospora sp. NPDC054939]
MSAFDEYLHALLVCAMDEARQEGSAAYDAQHLLLALAADHGSGAQQALAAAGLDHAALRAALEREFAHSLGTVGVDPSGFDLPAPSPDPQQPRMGASTRLALDRSFATARKKDLRSAHLLLGILQAQVGTVPRALALAGVDRAQLADRVRQNLDPRDR